MFITSNFKIQSELNLIDVRLLLIVVIRTKRSHQIRTSVYVNLCQNYLCLFISCCFDV